MFDSSVCDWWYCISDKKKTFKEVEQIILQKTQYATMSLFLQKVYKLFTYIQIVCMIIWQMPWLTVRSYWLILFLWPTVPSAFICLSWPRPNFLCLSLFASSFLILFLLFTSCDDTLWGIYYESNFTHSMKLYETFHSIFFIWPFHRRVHLCWLLVTPQCGPIPASFTDHKVLTDIKKQ